MPLELTTKIIKDYAEKKRKHVEYELTVDLYEGLKVHANGEIPTNIICERRPSEPDEIKDYREKIYEAMTKSPISRVISSLSKIKRSKDWSISFSEKKAAQVAEDERLETYLTMKYPYSFFGISNWLFSVCLKEYLLDANAIILTIPINIDKEVSDTYKPFPFIYNSPQVLEYIPEDYVILLSPKTCEYPVKDRNGNIVLTKTDGFIIHYVDKTRMVTYEQSSIEKDSVITQDFNHNLGTLPAFKMPGVFFKACEDVFINTSRIDGMRPHLNEASRLYSDLQAEIVQHVHSEKWLFMNTSCPTCNGLGFETIDDAKCECTRCHGVGRVPTSPFANHIITPPQMGEESLPTPPAGYIQKTDVALMCDKINGLFKEQIYSALASINMQFLDETPLNISGVGKEVDKEELNNFVYQVAEDLVQILDMVIFITNEWRTYGLISDAKTRALLLPKIPVPQNFDLLSSTYLIDELVKAKEKGLNPIVIAALEEEYAAKTFYNTPNVAMFMLLVYKLDPMPAISEENKIMRLQNDGVNQIDYIISSNIVPFIKRATMENPKFPSLSYEEQIAKMLEYALEKQQSISAAPQVIPEPEEEVVFE